MSSLNAMLSQQEKASLFQPENGAHFQSLDLTSDVTVHIDILNDN